MVGVLIGTGSSDGSASGYNAIGLGGSHPTPDTRSKAHPASIGFGH